MACNAKYYEDRGFPGHISCTDNFNSSLAEYGVKPRRNWAAVNLFFNTAIEECHSLTSDVSWSRPGDYVLLRAVDDLVCVSSACPDDTTSANGWNPTDIHVRIYDKSNNFSSATAFRPDPQSIPTMTKETGFHKNTSKLTKNFDNYNGYWLPLEYTNLGAIKEYWQCREGVVMIDLAPLRKFEFMAKTAEAFMQYAITKDVRKLAIGQVVYSAMCYENGCMVDDGTLFRLDDNNFRWIGGSDDGGKLSEKLLMIGVWMFESSLPQTSFIMSQFRAQKAERHSLKLFGLQNYKPRLRTLNGFVSRLDELGESLVFLSWSQELVILVSLVMKCSLTLKIVRQFGMQLQRLAKSLIFVL